MRMLHSGIGLCKLTVTVQYQSHLELLDAL